jgi:hypothetical protein
VSNVRYDIKLGFVPHMTVPGTVYVNDALKDLLFDELAQSVQRGEVGRAGRLHTRVHRHSRRAALCVEGRSALLAATRRPAGTPTHPHAPHSTAASCPL